MENIKTLYEQQRDETNHQNHRMVWLAAVESIMLMPIVEIIKYMYDKYSDNFNKPFIEIFNAAPDILRSILVVLISVFFLVAISGMYSLMISRITIGDLMEKGDLYKNVLPKERKQEYSMYTVICAPERILNSRFTWLAMNTFVPCVFMAAALTMLICVFI